MAAFIPPPSLAPRPSAGFTLFELILVMVLLGILSVFILPRLNDQAFSAYGYAEETRAALRYARQTAIARNSSVTVAFTSNGFSVCIGIAGTCSGNYLTNPANGRPWDGSGPGQGKAPEGVSIDTTLLTVTFDGLGRPSASGTLTIGPHVITIEAETGYVH